MNAKAATALLAGLVLAGCSSHRFYEGEALPRDQVATITVAKSWTGHQMVIKSVDGEEYQTQTSI